MSPFDILSAAGVAAALGAGLMVAIASWIAELGRRRRLARFGDPRVLPPAHSRRRRLAASAAFALACGAAAALVEVHAERRRSAPDLCSATLQLLIGHAAPPEETTQARWGDLEDTIRAVVRLAPPGACVSLYRAGETTELIGPATMDAEGIVRIASSLHETAAPPSPDRLRRSLETLLGSSVPRRRLIVVLSGAPEEIAALEALPRSDRAAVAVVAPGNAGEAIPLVEARLRDLEDHAGSVARDGRDVARPLALAALLALVVEALLSRTSFGAGA